MRTILGAILMLFLLWLAVVVDGTPDDPEEWDAPVRWGVFVQFLLWVVLLFACFSVVDATA